MTYTEKITTNAYGIFLSICSVIESTKIIVFSIYAPLISFIIGFFFVVSLVFWLLSLKEFGILEFPNSFTAHTVYGCTETLNARLNTPFVHLNNFFMILYHRMERIIMKIYVQCTIACIVHMFVWKRAETSISIFVLYYAPLLQFRHSSPTHLSYIHRYT